MSKTCVLYARVSTAEQANSGFSLRQQLERLRDHAETEGLTVLEEVQDPGQSGASLERPGLDRVRDLVADGGVSVVLAQDRDRFAREPAYLFLLKQEFGERGCRMRALNDQGGDDEEGELMNGMLDQLAKYERAKIAQRTRRGRERKAREGRIVGAQPRPRWGFRYNDVGDGYVVDEGEMTLVRRLFELVADGLSLRSIKKLLESEGVATPRNAQFWNTNTIRKIVLNDVYRPHSFEEVVELVGPQVAAGLDPSKSYGVSYYGQRKTSTKQVAEHGPEGRRYRRKQTITYRDRSEWISIPVPDSTIPRELVDVARARIADNRPPSHNAGRTWSLSGGVLICGECGHPMQTDRRRNRKDATIFHHYYRCSQRRRNGAEACAQGKSFAAEKIEEQVWSVVVALTENPWEMVRAADRAVARERARLHGDPDREGAFWLDRLAALDQQRSRAQEMALRGLLDYDELGTKLSQLEADRETARRELEASRGRLTHVRALEEMRASLQRYAESCDEFERDTPPLQYSLMKPIWAVGPFAQRHRAEMVEKTPDERMQVYKELGIRAEIDLDGEVSIRGLVPLGEEVCTVGTTSR